MKSKLKHLMPFVNNRPCLYITFDAKSILKQGPSFAGVPRSNFIQSSKDRSDLLL